MRPTRFIDHEEFEKLTKETGDTIDAYRLTNVSFDPAIWSDSKTAVSVRVLFLNVIEPVLYFDKEKTGFVIAPVFEELTYETARDMHLVKKARCFRLARYGWDKVKSELSDAVFFFKEEDGDDIPPFEKGRSASH